MEVLLRYEWNDILGGGKRVSDRSTVPQWIKGEGKYIDGYIKQERRSLNRYLMIHFLRSYDNFLVRKVNFLNREHDAYSQAFEARVYQHRYHGYYGPKK